jgi:hypothetical protein
MALLTIVESTVLRSSVELIAWKTSPSVRNSLTGLAETVGAVMQLIRQPCISIVITERSSGVAKVERFGPRMPRRSTFHFVIARMSIAVTIDLVAPAIVGAGAVGWSGATSAVGQELPT